jgi:hypothetical protein
MRSKGAVLSSDYRFIHCKKKKTTQLYWTSPHVLFRKVHFGREEKRREFYLQIGQSSPIGELLTLLFWVASSELFQRHHGSQTLQSEMLCCIQPGRGGKSQEVQHSVDPPPTVESVGTPARTCPTGK